MIVFNSMKTISVLTAVTVALLIWYGTGRQPFSAAAAFVRKLAVSPLHLVTLAALLLILAFNKLELSLEAALPVTHDLTHALTGWEGSWQSQLQHLLESPWLTLVCAFFYLVVFQAFVVASLFVYVSSGNYRLYFALCVAMLLNYLVALPFYVFVPVHEAWSVSSQIRFLMLDVYPNFETQYRQLSGLDNCFPSLHTSISATMALLAIHSGNRRWAIFGTANAVIIFFSIFYLGIHWATDMFAGLALACFAVAVGLGFGTWASERSDKRLDRQRSLSAKIKKLGPSSTTES
ncbi:phosphatase PAP2 family protein [Cohnella sp. 56]|uniref:phosphatase PAP2 family protein n=1 Tax=Cohnella sp. 56 TaxID=3113722 RepID=UPI0030E94186